MKSVKRVRTPAKDAVRWGMYRLRRKAERIGYVQAADPQAALERPCETLAIPENERWRINVQRASG
jgi:hypothetical protein